MKLRTDKWQQLEDFVAELARKRVPENVAVERTAKKAKRLGIVPDDGEVAEMFEQHYTKDVYGRPEQQPRKRKQKPKSRKRKA